MEEFQEKRLLLADFMDSKPCILAPDTTLAQALEQISQQQKESCVVVHKSGSIGGALELTDIYAALHAATSPQSIADLIVAQSVQFGPEAELEEALVVLQKNQAKGGLVVTNGTLLGEVRLSRIALHLPEILQHKDKKLAELKADYEREDEYLGLVCHDLRAPLTVIALSSDYLLGEDSSRALNQDQRSFVERIRRNGAIASSLIRDILDVIRLDHGFRLDCQDIRFADLMDDCVQNMQLLANRKRLSFEVKHEQDIRVKLDPKRMRQVIDNLLMNAIKFSPTGGQIFIRCYLADKTDGPQLAFEVRDQGQGIKKDDEARVFQAFVQKSGSQNKEGLGLGLAIVRKLVDFHQGSVEVDGGWQKGARITVFVPNASLWQAPQPAPAAASGPLILVVDDDESIREVCRQALEDQSYQVLEAKDGVEALALFQKHAVDLVLSDIRMPKLDGLELLAQIRTLSGQVPVILFSGYYVGLETDLGGSAHKPNRIIDKPFKIADMIAVIEDQLHRVQQAS